MGLVGGILGIGGPPDPSQANLDIALNSDNARDVWNATNTAIGGQDKLLSALQGQNGLGNQSQMFGALGNTADQYQGVVNGTGPNPAQAMLNQSTGQNVANQAALMAGQRGAGANVGLMARQAAQQGAATQQQAAGQAATMQAQQSLNALQGLAGVQGQQGALATQMAGQQIGQTNQNVNTQQAQLQQTLNTIAAQNNAKVGSQSSVNSANASQKAANTGAFSNLLGGAMNALGGGAAMLGGEDTGGGGAATGAMAGMGFGQMKAAGGVVSPQPQQPQGPQSDFVKGFMGATGSPGVQSSANNLVNAMKGPAKSQGGLVDVVVSPGEKIVPPEEVQKVAMGGKPQMKTVPGKAEVKGDSLKNDKVPAKLPAGTIVVKRTRANNNPEGFIKEVLSKRKGRK